MMKCRWKWSPKGCWITCWIWIALISPTFEQGTRRDYAGIGGQSIVPGGFQQQLYTSQFPTPINRNSRVIPPSATSVQNQQFGFFPSQNIRTSQGLNSNKQLLPPNFIGLQFPVQQQPQVQSIKSNRPQVVATNNRGEVQYEYYDEPEEDIIYQYGTDINDQGNSQPGPSDKTIVGKGIEVLEGNRRPISPSSGRSPSNLPPQSFTTAQLGSKSSPRESANRGNAGYLRETSSFIPLIGHDEEPDPSLALNGRSVQQNSRLNNLPIRPPNGLLRSTTLSPPSTASTAGPVQRASSQRPRSRGSFSRNATATAPSSVKPVRTTPRRPAPQRGNRFTITGRPPGNKDNQSSKDSVVVSSSTYRPDAAPEKSRRSEGAKDKYVLSNAPGASDTSSASDDYTIEYIEYPGSPEDDKSAFEYYEVSEETAAAILANRTKTSAKSEGKAKPKETPSPSRVTSSMSVSKSSSTTVSISSTTTPAPISISSSSSQGQRNSENVKGKVVVSVSTTKSISGSKLSREMVTRGPVTPTPRVSSSRATAAPVVVASVQTSQSVVTGSDRPTEPTPSAPSTETLKDSVPSGAETSPEYYEEEYSYPENFPIRSGDGGRHQSTSTSVSSSSSSREAKANEKELELTWPRDDDKESDEHVHPQPRKLPSKSAEVPIGHFETLVDFGDLDSDQRIPIVHDQHLEEEVPFSPSSSTTTTTTTTTPTPVPITGIKFAEISPNLLPPGFKFPPSEEIVASEPPRSTTSKPTPSTPSAISFDEIPSFLLPKGYKPLATQAPSTTAIPLVELESLPPGFLPKGYKPFSSPSVSSTPTPSSSETPPPKNPIEALLSKVKFKEIAIPGLIPKDYKPESTGIKFETPSNLLPPGYKPPQDPPAPEIKFEIPSNLLPAGFKPAGEPSSETPPIKFEIPANLLPAGYKPPGSGYVGPVSTTRKPAGPVFPTKPPGGGLVFPTKPGGFRVTRPTTTEGPKADTPPPPRVTIAAAGWPTRKTTEFTGWPTTSTTPTPSTSTSSTSTTTTERPTTTATTTTTTPPPPKRSPLGVCPNDVCRMEATIRITGGVKWKPEFADINTDEYKHLKSTVIRELDGAYRASGLAPWYKKVDIEGFNKGSVLVDYFVQLEGVDRELTTADVVKVFHKSLLDSDPGDELPLETEAPGALRFGRYNIDPRYTDFKLVTPKTGKGASQPEPLIPQWGIAVIVIGLVSLLFVFILGVIVLVSRYKNSKKKNTVSLTQEMLNEFNKSHMAVGGGGGSGGVDNFGADDLYNMDDVWNDKQMDRTFDRRPTKRSQGSTKGSANYNIYDSWKTEWNGYYYNGNYYGDSGYAPSRRRSDYDTNF